METKKKIAYLALWWGWMPLGYFIVSGVLRLGFGGMSFVQTIDQWFMANFGIMTPLVCLWLTIGLIGSVFLFLCDQEEATSNDWRHTEYTRTVISRSKVMQSIAAILVICSVFTSVQSVKGFWDNDKDYGRYYNRATTFYVPDTTDVPDSLKLLVKGAHAEDGKRCDLTGNADVPSCIKQGKLAETGWEPRIGSLDGARYAMTRSSGDAGKVSLNADTMAYLNGSADQKPRWSGVMDGSGTSQGIGGVAEWSGSGKATQCLFAEEYEIDRAFGGERGNDLKNLLAEKYAGLRFSMTDVWGYCDGREPIVVVPMTRQIYFKNRTVDTAGGVVIIRGQNGHAVMKHKQTVKSGELPGPVYPASLVERQRDMSSWAAGRKIRDRNGFGYDPANAEVQAGNVSEYLLRNKATSRLEWVTPLTLRSSSSELFVAYAISPADEVSDGQLNQLSIYVLGEDDPRRINIDNLEADARNYLAENGGAFLSSGGKLVEFTPVDGDIWRGFAEMNGRVAYRLDISANNTTPPKLVSLTKEATPTRDGEDPNVECGKPLEQLTPSQLTNCMVVLSTELNERQSQTAMPEGEGGN